MSFAIWLRRKGAHVGLVRLELIDVLESLKRGHCPELTVLWIFVQILSAVLHDI